MLGHKVLTEARRFLTMTRSVPTGCKGFYATLPATTPEGQGILRSFVRELPEICQPRQKRTDVKFAASTARSLELGICTYQMGKGSNAFENILRPCLCSLASRYHASSWMASRCHPWTAGAGGQLGGDLPFMQEPADLIRDGDVLALKWKQVSKTSHWGGRGFQCLHLYETSV